MFDDEPPPDRGNPETARNMELQINSGITQRRKKPEKTEPLVLKKMEDWRSGLYFLQFKHPLLPEPPLSIEMRMWRFRRLGYAACSGFINPNWKFNPFHSIRYHWFYFQPIQSAIPATQRRDRQAFHLMNYHILP